jgi:Glycosyl-4,4'-diaponeurosporenoate acyltransferase
MMRGMRACLAALAIQATAGLFLLASLTIFGPRGPLVPLALNAFLLFEMAGVSRVIGLPMPAAYFRPRRFEHARIYERLVIRGFKRLMRSALYRRINPEFRLSGGRSGLAELGERRRAAEAVHALLFVIASVVAGGALLLRWFEAAAWLTLFNVLLNGYPVMLQRYNRLRLERPRAAQTALVRADGGEREHCCSDRAADPGGPDGQE